MISWENSFETPFWEAIILNECWSEHKEAGLMCRLPKDSELEVCVFSFFLDEFWVVAKVVIIYRKVAKKWRFGPRKSLSILAISQI
jgi:hypothetical protein